MQIRIQEVKNRRKSAKKFEIFFSHWKVPVPKRSQTAITPNTVEEYGVKCCGAGAVFLLVEAESRSSGSGYTF